MPTILCVALRGRRQPPTTVAGMVVGPTTELSTHLKSSLSKPSGGVRDPGRSRYASNSSLRRYKTAISKRTRIQPSSSPGSSSLSLCWKAHWRPCIPSFHIVLTHLLKTVTDPSQRQDALLEVTMQARPRAPANARRAALIVHSASASRTGGRTASNGASRREAPPPAATPRLAAPQAPPYPHTLACQPHLSTMPLMEGARRLAQSAAEICAPNPLASQQGGQRCQHATGLGIGRTRPPQQPRRPFERHQARMALAPLGSGPPAPPAARALALPQHPPEMSCCFQTARDR